MQNETNPFSESLSDKRMFDWSYNMTAEQHNNYSLQRYKELFFFFISCFNSGKIELLENDLFNDSWDIDYNKTVGCQVFHLAVNCYLYYYGYREKDNLVDKEKKSIAKLLLKKIIIKNRRYLKTLNYSFIKEHYLIFFLQEAEIMPKDEIGKTMTLPVIIRDFLIFSLLVSSCYQINDLSSIIKQNLNTVYYQSYITKENEKKALFKDFLRIFINDETVNSDLLYNFLKKALQKIFTEKKLIDSKEKMKLYKTRYSEEVLGNEYIKQIKVFLERSFATLQSKSKKEKKIKLVNKLLLDYQLLTSFVDKNFSQMSMNALLFNLVSIISDYFIQNKIITQCRINTENLKDYLDFLSNNSLNFLIGPQDLVAPHNYRNLELLERYDKEFTKLYILGWFREILALNSNSVSISLENFRTEFSTPSFEEIKEDFIQEDDCFRKKNETECFTKDELQVYIENTYRNIKIFADIDLSFNKNAGILIFPCSIKEDD